MPHTYKPWLWFLSVQALAVVAGLVCTLFTSELGPALWFVSFYLLLPGELLFGVAVERTLWTSHLSVTAFYTIDTLAAVAGNAIIFGAILWLVRRWRNHGAI
jgi:hypothetical protein